MQPFPLESSLKKKISHAIFILFLLFLVSFRSQAQQRNYRLVYSENLKGGTTMFGNSLMQISDDGEANMTKMNDNSANGNSYYGNDYENMQYIDIDGSTGNGNVTRNSSSSDLILPGGINTIKLARLYWGGRVTNSDF
ncbi:MAG TPA: hypothetical protein VGW31_11405, partial [Hanamia sp.]|nr:hypothetical protein [Hanamia sp.]